MKVTDCFCCIYLCVLTIERFFSCRDRSVFWDPTSTSFHPVDWWRQIWSSHSHYRQALSILYCEFSHWYVSYFTGWIVLKPLGALEPLARALRVSNIRLYSVFVVCYVDWRGQLFVATLFHVILWSEDVLRGTAVMTVQGCFPTLNLMNITGVTETETFYDKMLQM